MATQTEVPTRYYSKLISTIKQGESAVIDLGHLRFKVAKHFGLCFGVSNAIKTAYQAIAENEGRRIFLLSEIIHNPIVNQDLQSEGLRFLFSPEGEQLIPFSALHADDVVIIPAFGATLELLHELEQAHVKVRLYDTTCPFVVRVWKTAERMCRDGFTVIVHGKPNHEETKATFSRCRAAGAALIVSGLQAAKSLCAYIVGDLSEELFEVEFSGVCSDGFKPARDLSKLGVVNQTTMPATETVKISHILREALAQRYGASEIESRFFDTSGTLCLATDQNQASLQALLESGGDLVLIVGGYNSSNTAHLAAMSRAKLPTYHIEDADEIIDLDTIRHYDALAQSVVISRSWFPQDVKRPEILISAGASCPDSVVEEVLNKIKELGATP
ncbi:MAG: 4-hydroxy-3-methylbut-2-enyl diphosphate reductase [Deltaproteobacteria bacterium]|nr:4-hydroxy-3-methylbut-2-enyl diphosphate reductase [Deltaproteobacteria bacterium]